MTRLVPGQMLHAHAGDWRTPDGKLGDTPLAGTIARVGGGRRTPARGPMWIGVALVGATPPVRQVLVRLGVRPSRQRRLGRWLAIVVQWGWPSPELHAAAADHDHRRRSLDKRPDRHGPSPWITPSPPGMPGWSRADEESGRAGRWPH